MKLYNLTFTAVFAEDPEGGYSAYIEEIPGANTQGETIEGAKENLVEALQMVHDANKAQARKNPVSGNCHREPLVFV